jgi:hypothetical protein
VERIPKGRRIMSDFATRYTVRLDGRKITYLGANECQECGYVDNDSSFFYEKEGKLFCSLHKGEAI